MSSGSLQAYLAQNYMSGPKVDAILSRVSDSTSSKKKKKRRMQTNQTPSAGPSTIVDDDAGWGRAVPGTMNDDEDDIKDAVVEKDRSFKKRKTGNRKNDLGNGEGDGWTTVREGLVSGKIEAEEMEAGDEKPQVVGEQGFAGGLVTSSSLKAHSSSRDVQKKSKQEIDAEREAQQSQTVYRDATGRKVDVKVERAEAARLKREAEEREARKMEWGKGLVQREEEQKRKEQIEKERGRGLAVYADDDELNKEQKEKERWNDPAAAFLSVCILESAFDEYLLIYLFIYSFMDTEKEKQRTTKTGIQWASACTKPVWNQAWVPVGWSW